MDWVVQDGTVRIPDHVSFEEASFLEPLNTCLKALETLAIKPGEVVAIFGQGPIGLLLMQAARIGGAVVVGLDVRESRLQVSRELGAEHALDPRSDPVASILESLTEGRGADCAIVATADPEAIAFAQQFVRRGGAVMLFAQTVPGERIAVDGSRICMEEKKLIGSYSASVELQNTAAELVFSGAVNVSRLITHRFALDLVAEGIRLASSPSEDSLKVILQP
jgi:L-iditol 2-dehydrogenase